ncbi:TPA: hypothetical protein DDW35_06610 [Candidatus Sumerlaeota bacterium]|nr:hypothetical protein [Candidatus Sumerlaeota bacterium]
MLDGFPDKYRFTNDAEAIKELLAFLKNPQYQRIVVCGHVRPDGDCIGSMMAMYHYLQGLGKEVRIFARHMQMENLLAFLPDGQAPAEEYPTDFAADATVVLDISDPKRVVADFVDVTDRPMVCIDHHATHQPFADLCWVDEHAAATGELLFRLFDADNALTPEIASCLYVALISDTGGFRFGNTSSSALAAAATLVSAGAKPAELAGKVWGNVPRETVEISAHVFSHLHFEMDGAFVWAEITQDIFNAHGGEKNDPDNLSGEMRSIKGVQVALLLREGADGSARGSLRSSGKADVSKIVAPLGGGGHRAASGLEIPGPYAESSQKILAMTRSGLLAQLQSQ